MTQPILLFHNYGSVFCILSQSEKSRKETEERYTAYLNDAKEKLNMTQKQLEGRILILVLLQRYVHTCQPHTYIQTYCIVFYSRISSTSYTM